MCLISAEIRFSYSTDKLRIYLITNEQGYSKWMNNMSSMELNNIIQINPARKASGLAASAFSRYFKMRLQLVQPHLID